MVLGMCGMLCILWSSQESSAGCWHLAIGPAQPTKQSMPFFVKVYYNGFSSLGGKLGSGVWFSMRMSALQEMFESYLACRVWSP